MKEGKMIRNSLILVVIAAVLAVIFSPLFGSRAEAKTGKAGTDNSPIQAITTSKSSISFSYAGGTQTVTISGTKGNIRAERTSSASWVSVAVSGRTVTISAPRNTGAARTGSIAIIDLATGQSVMIMVVQAGAPTPTPTPTPAGGSKTTGPKGGTIKIQLPGRGPYRVEKTVTWMSVSISGSTVTITLAENKGAARTANLIVIDTSTGQTISYRITQSGAPTPTPTKKPTPTVTKAPTKAPTKTPTPTPAGGSTRAVGSKGGTFTIQLPGKGPYLARTTATWLTVSISGSKATIKVAENKGAARTARVTFVDESSGQSISCSVHQSAAPTPTPTKKPTPTPTKKPTPTPTKKPTATPTPAPKSYKVTLKVGAAGGTKTVTLPFTVNGSLRAKNSLSWVTVVSVSGTKISVSVMKNTGAARSGNVTFTDSAQNILQVYISQDAAPTPTPTKKPTPTPTKKPTPTPTKKPTPTPTKKPTATPTPIPTVKKSVSQTTTQSSYDNVAKTAPAKASDGTKAAERNTNSVWKSTTFVGKQLLAKLFRMMALFRK